MAGNRPSIGESSHRGSIGGSSHRGSIGGGTPGLPHGGTPGPSGFATPGGTTRLPGGSLPNSAAWLSMKNPDLLSASERVLHNNQMMLAYMINQTTQALNDTMGRSGNMFSVQIEAGFINRRQKANECATGSRAASKEPVTAEETETQQRDEEIIEELQNDPVIKSHTRDFLQRALGASDKTALCWRAGKPAEKEAADFLKILQTAVVEEQKSIEEHIANAMDENEDPPQPVLQMMQSKILKLSKGDKGGLVRWYNQSVVQNDLGGKGKRGAPTKKDAQGGKAGKGAEGSKAGKGAEGSKAAGKKRKAEVEAEDEDEDEEEDTSRHSKRQRPGSRKSTNVIDEDEESEDGSE
ncbi:hypothetical protein M409DRAFT_48839 [Zasmidium cellare ATCC 36951]|uniref:Uncharacterized protein n=1 Tax=Zasmidium cellare ATCC 36951 TaxID=1080233 RepID=A0A6A6D6S1_ZASCE|nr:uncharacterized protein M409DRAFT_48839 [Zasmidium cellare ATCC 36951]KAF2173932.1 hypothetical protein M409DRAFT_48839 [Zasmidium cellare ATCC 36951]